MRVRAQRCLVHMFHCCVDCIHVTSKCSLPTYRHQCRGHCLSLPSSDQTTSLTLSTLLPRSRVGQSRTHAASRRARHTPPFCACLARPRHTTLHATAATRHFALPGQEFVERAALLQLLKLLEQRPLADGRLLGEEWLLAVLDCLHLRLTSAFRATDASSCCFTRRLSALSRFSVRSASRLSCAAACFGRRCFFEADVCSCLSSCHTAH